MVVTKNNNKKKVKDGIYIVNNSIYIGKGCFINGNYTGTYNSSILLDRNKIVNILDTNDWIFVASFSVYMKAGNEVNKINIYEEMHEDLDKKEKIKVKNKMIGKIQKKYSGAELIDYSKLY